MTEKFTLGPWRIEKDRHGTINAISTNEGTGAVLYGCGCCGSPNLELANARLIAAAPELFEALHRLESAFMAHTRWNGEPPAEILAARAAIQKATGE